jgi:hypothetical protein
LIKKLDLWKNGPDFLLKDRDHWTKLPIPAKGKKAKSQPEDDLMVHLDIKAYKEQVNFLTVHYRQNPERSETVPTCMTNHAVHVELVPDCSSKEFLVASRHSEQNWEITDRIKERLLGKIIEGDTKRMITPNMLAKGTSLRPLVTPAPSTFNRVMVDDHQS